MQRLRSRLTAYQRARTLGSHHMAAISFSQCWPYFGQRVHFAIFQTEPNPSVQARYQRLSNDIFAVLDRHLSQHAFFAGTEYSSCEYCVVWLDTHYPPQQRVRNFCSPPKQFSYFFSRLKGAVIQHVPFFKVCHLSSLNRLQKYDQTGNFHTTYRHAALYGWLALCLSATSHSHQK